MLQFNPATACGGQLSLSVRVNYFYPWLSSQALHSTDRSFG